MSRILTGICEADPAEGYTKWPSVGETLFCLQKNVSVYRSVSKMP